MTEQTRAMGPEWSFSWSGEQASAFRPEAGKPATILPDGLGLISQKLAKDVVTLPFFVELDAGRQPHGQYHHDWGRKIVGYDRFSDSNWRLHRELSALAHFPQVLVITHGEQRTVNLARAIADKRKKEVYYLVTEWRDLLIAPNLFTTPIWIEIHPTGQLMGEAREARRPLIAFNS